MVRRLIVATALAALAALFGAPAALAQYDYDSGDSSSEGAETSSQSESAEESSEESGGGSKSGEWVTLSATLTGEAEVPGPGDADGTGNAVVKLKDDKICFNLSWSNIEPATLGHIHKGAKGAAGDPVVDFFTKAPAVREGCVEADQALVKRIAANPANYYVNVHTADFPKGAIRGQLAKSNGSLPFTGPGDTSSRLLWIGAAITVGGAGILIASRRLGVGRHLATAGRHLSRR